MGFPKYILEKDLSRSFEESLVLFKSLRSSKDVAFFFEISEGQLIYILYDKRAEAEKYKTTFIKKKLGGMREINIPSNGINILQRKLKPFLEHIYRPRKPAHGFVKGKSILKNAKEHLKRKYILNVDLEDFYGSISFARIRGMFLSKSFNMGPNAAAIMAQLVTFNNKLPQGACTSPVLSNLIASQLDKKLLQLASKYYLSYTRYADDITLSTTKKEFPKGIVELNENPIYGAVELGEELKFAIHESDFRINYKKVRIQFRDVRQEVTGLTVNEFPNVKRKFVRQIRGMIYAYKKYGPVLAEKIHFEKYNSKYSPKEYTGRLYINVLLGKIAYLKMIRGSNDAILSKLVRSLDQTNIELPKYLKGILEMTNKYRVFIGHASEDKDKIALPLHKEFTSNSISAFIDQSEIRWGDSLTEKINHALSNSEYFLAILSEHSINKKWPVREINSAISREINGKQVFLPLIVGDPDKVLKDLPLLADKLYIKWNGNPKDIIEKFKEL